MNRQKYLGKVIAYRNDALKEKNINEAFICGFNSEYPAFFKVSNFNPVYRGEPLNVRMLYLPKSEKKNLEELKESGNWCVLDRELTRVEIRKLNEKRR